MREVARHRNCLSASNEQMPKWHLLVRLPMLTGWTFSRQMLATVGCCVVGWSAYQRHPKLCRTARLISSELSPIVTRPIGTTCAHNSPHFPASPPSSYSPLSFLHFPSFLSPSTLSPRLFLGPSLIPSIFLLFSIHYSHPSPFCSPSSRPAYQPCCTQTQLSLTGVIGL